MRTMLLLVLFLFSTLTLANIESVTFADEAMETRYNTLINELRCLVCQNQNLADSNAELAQDLRKQVHKMLDQGKSDQEIVDFMVQRYGDFVLYRPPFKTRTLLLWLGPFVFLLIGVWFLIRYITSQVARSPSIVTDEEHLRATELLGENESKKNTSNKEDHNA